MIITTSPSSSEALTAKAKQFAERSGGRFAARRRFSVDQLLEKAEDGLVLVVTEAEMRLYKKDAKQSEQPLTYHPSMAYVKLKGMMNGKIEPLITYSGCEAGDYVLDCTAGLASDSLLFSMQVGETGKVVAVESQLPLYLIVSEGLKHYQAPVEEIEAAMRRIEMVNASHYSYLKALPDKSFDIVYFDPMFRQPLQESTAIRPLRNVANHDALSKQSIEEAKRVARKCVILKEHSGSPEFARLGFTPIGKQIYHKPAYGIISCKEV